MVFEFAYYFGLGHQRFSGQVKGHRDLGGFGRHGRRVLHAVFFVRRFTHRLWAVDVDQRFVGAIDWRAGHGAGAIHRCAGVGCAQRGHQAHHG